MIELLSPVMGECFSVMTEISKEFKKRQFAGEHHGTNEVAYSRLCEYYDCKSDASVPAKVRLIWKNSAVNGPNRVTLRLESGELPAGSIASIGKVMYCADTDTFSVDVTNLLSGEKYAWSVDESEEGHFVTERGEMRNISVPVMTNVRDMGGRINAEGKRLRQGLAYRGTAPDDLSKKNLKSELKTIRALLGVKCDIDFRAESVGKFYTSPFGYDVRFELIPFDAYGSTLNDIGRATLRRILEVFADKSSYPIYFHCWAGADRTGTVGAYLDAILGMSDDEILFNYNVTTLANFDCRCWFDGDCGEFQAYLEEVYPKLGIRERLMKNLRLSGISEDTIEAIRKLLIE